MLITVDNIRRHILTIEGKHPSKETLLNYRLKNNVEYIEQCSINHVRLFNKNTVIFISDRPNFFFLRISKSLMNIGFRTVLLTRWGVDEEHSTFFDEVLLFDSLLDLSLLSNISSSCIYVQSWVGWFFLPVFVDLITESDVYCNVNDSSILLFDKVESFSHIGIDKENAVFDIECEKYVYEKLKLVTHPYKDINKISDIPSSESLHYFPCYPLGEFIHNAKRSYSELPNLVFIGGIPYDNKNDLIFKDAKIHNIVRKIIKQKLHLTILNNPLMTQSKEDVSDKYRFFNNLSKNNSNFDFSSGYAPWKLYKKTQKYAYGIMIYDFSNILVSKNHIQSIVPTKFFTYIELGIPVIVINEMKAVSDIVKKNNLGIVISKNKISLLEKIIESKSDEYSCFLDSIENYITKNNMEHKINEILPLFNLA